MFLCHRMKQKPPIWNYANLCYNYLFIWFFTTLFSPLKFNFFFFLNNITMPLQSRSWTKTILYGIIIPRLVTSRLHKWSWKPQWKVYVIMECPQGEIPVDNHSNHESPDKKLFEFLDLSLLHAPAKCFAQPRLLVDNTPSIFILFTSNTKPILYTRSISFELN